MSLSSSGVVSKLLAQSLFWISCLLSVVSFYTTREGMALYLSPWFSFLAAFGVQSALVIVAWLFGSSARQDRRGGGAVLVAVYVITAIISVAFSYVSLNTWFSERERPAMVQRELYDELHGVASRTEPLLADAAANGRRYTLALEEMAEAEKLHGRLSAASDGDPYLDTIREAVAREGAAHREGTGAGVRYSAFSRHAQLTRQSTEAVETARRAMAQAKAALRPGMATDAQLRQFHQAYDSVPWSLVEQLRGPTAAKMERPALPAYARFVERSASGQEDMMRAFGELLANPGPRNIVSAALAAFIDIIVFLLAFAAGPYLHGEKDERWYAASAALDSHDRQVFARELLRKIRPGRQGMPRVDAEGLSPGEQQLCLLLVNDGQAVWQPDGEPDGTGAHYLLDAETYRRMAETVASPSLAFRAAPPKAA